MFCKNCGREIPENARFCGGCGTPVSRPEEIPVQPESPAEPIVPPAEPVPAAPQEPREPEEPRENIPPESGPEPVVDDLTAALEPPAAPVPVAVAPVPEVQPIAQPGFQEGGKPPILGRKKGRGTVLILLAAVLAVITLVVAVVTLLPSMGGGKENVVFRTGDEELMFRKDLKAKTEAEELTDDLASWVRFSPNGKYLYFMEYDSSTGNGDLFRIEVSKIGRKDASPEKISSNVSTYDLLSNGNALYLRGSGSDKQLRFYDGKDSYKLASGLGSYSVNAAETYAYYSETDSSDGSRTFYRVEIKENGEKEKLLKDYDELDYFGDDLLVYRKAGEPLDEWGSTAYDVYSQVPGGDKTKLVSDAASVFGVAVSGGKVSFTYLTAETESHTLYDFVSDSLAVADASEQEPDTDDFQTWGYWGWTVDWDAYNAAYQTWEQVAERNYMREYMKATAHDVTTYALCRYENGEKTTLAEGLAYTPTSSVADGIYIYAKSEQEVSQVADLKDLAYADEVYNLMGTAEREWYQNIGGVESPMKLDEDSEVDGLFVLNGSEAVLSLYEDGESILKAYTLNKNELTPGSTITDEEYRGLSVGTWKGKDVLYYFTDVDSDSSSGELMRYGNGEKTSVAKDACQVTILADSGAVFKVEDQKYNSRKDISEGSLYLMKDGKGTRITDEADLAEIAYLGANRVLYISDGDLRLWTGKDSEKLASDVNTFWVNNVAGSETYYCYFG